MRRISTALLILCLLNTARAQNIDSTIATYATAYPQEKIFLHYDKAAYAAGETIWFKAYLMESLFPANASKTFYADWTDDKGKLIHRTLSPVVEGTTNGQFDIPADFKGKSIHVRAYTKWMLNFDTAFLYNKDIRILATTAPPANTKAPAIVTSLRFFPEGGDAVAGVLNKIAFKAADQWGRPVKIKGTIRNKAGELVDSLKIVHDGMGFFFTNPKAGDELTAKWKDEKGTEYTTPLPAIKASGITMQVATASNKSIFTISSPVGAPGNPGTVHIMGTMNQVQVFRITKDISSGQVKGSIPVDQLPSGILTITVFDGRWTPLAERVIFVNNYEYLFESTFNVAHWGLNKRARNDIEISVPDSLVANMSIAITDAGIETDSSGTILSHLLLTSDIRGYVFNPSYYFSSRTEKVNNHLDLVMLTNGWRRFKWEEIAAGKFPQISYPRDTSYMTMSGKVYGLSPAAIKDAGDIILLTKQKKSEGGMLVLPLKPDGSFNDPAAIFFDSTTVYYQFQQTKGTNSATVRFLENKLPPLSKNVPAGNFFNPFDTAGSWRHSRFALEAADILKQYEGKLLENVVVKSKTKTPIEVLDEKYASGMFSGGGNSYKFDLINDVAARATLNIFTYLQGRVAGLQITNTGGTAPSMTWRNATPQLFLNEMRADASMISSIPVSDVAYIKVFPPPFMGAPGGGAGGAIAIYTRNGSDVKSEPGKGLASNTVMGYTELREFSSPNYSSFKPENERKDIRTTIYWNPQVSVNGNNKVKLSFYNNDISTSFRVIIQGMTTDGRLSYFEQLMD